MVKKEIHVKEELNLKEDVTAPSLENIAVIEGGPGSEEWLKLKAKRASLNVRDIDMSRAFLSYSYPPSLEDIIPFKWRKDCAEYGVAAAMLKGTITTEEGAAVRGILPSIDLLDRDYQRLKHNEWRTPIHDYYGEVHRDNWFDAYRTDRQCYNYLKAYVIFGACKAYKDAKVYATRMDIFRADVRLIEVQGLEELDVAEVVCFNAPILFKPGDPMKIRYYLGSNCVGHNDNIAPLGFVIEPLGHSSTGS